MNDETKVEPDGTTVYVVTVGEYSDYHIMGIFSEREAADRAAKLTGGQVKDWALDQPAFEDPQMDYYTIALTKAGETKATREPRLDQWGERHSCFARVTIYNHWQLHWGGYAKGPGHAARSARELRRQILAGQRPEEVDFAPPPSGVPDLRPIPDAPETLEQTRDRLDAEQIRDRLNAGISMTGED